MGLGVGFGWGLFKGRRLRTMARCSVLSLVAALVSALVAAPAFAQTLTLAVSHGPVSLPIYVAQHKGYFDREGVKVTTRECSSGRTCFQLLAQGDVQAATASELMVTLNSFKRTDFAIIGTLSTSSHQIKLVARRSAGIHEAAHIKGKRVATVVGTSAQYFLDSWLSFQGIDPASVTTVALEPDQLVSALRRGEADAVAIWEPLASAAMSALADDALPLPSPRVYTQHFNLVTDRKSLKDRAPDFLRVLRALALAERFIATEPVQAQAILRSRLAIGEAEATGYLKEHDFRMRLDQSLISTMESQARWAIRQGRAEARDRPSNFLQTIEPSLLRKAAPASVTLVQ